MKILDLIRGRSEQGATSVEYGLMLALICGAIIIAVGFFGEAVLGLFQEIPPNLGRN
jgi:Flp pilus assembly pilin Flp